MTIEELKSLRAEMFRTPIQTTLHTPLSISIALHYHVTGGEDYRNLDAPAVHGSIVYFCKEGLLTEIPNGTEQIYEATEKLHAWCRAICSVPIPKPIWVNPDTYKAVPEQ